MGNFLGMPKPRRRRIGGPERVGSEEERVTHPLQPKESAAVEHKIEKDYKRSSKAPEGPDLPMREPLKIAIPEEQIEEKYETLRSAKEGG